MTGTVPTFTAQVAVECGNKLGEGITWTGAEVVWVDIERAQIHTLTSTGEHSLQSYPDAGYVSAVASTSSGSLVAAYHDRVVHLPSTGDAETLIRLIEEGERGEVRLNDGACDAAGRLLVGSMNLAGLDAPPLGRLFSLSARPPSASASTGRDQYEARVLLEGVGCSNGIDWSPDNTLLYYVDSARPRVDVCDYDLPSGTISNRRPFVSADSLPPLPPHSTLHPGEDREEEGNAAPMVAFDGLVVDGAGNVWVARWGESRLICYSPEGEVLLQVATPRCRSPTIPCFGGAGLDTLYIASARADLAGERQEDWPESGDVFALKVGEEMRAVLGGEGWRGRARHGFRLAPEHS